MLKNNRLIQTLTGQPTDRTPVWVMRQAGRYLPEYRQTRQQAGGFMDLCRRADLACEVTLQPLRRYPQLDAAILFSDILTLPDAMGLTLSFAQEQGPILANPVRDSVSVRALHKPPKNSLNYVYEAVKTIHQALDETVPLIGFSGSPWTLACYMVQGQSSRDFAALKSMIYQDPETAHYLLDLLTEVVTEYLQQQIEAGVEVVQIFDTWGGLLSEQAYNDFSLHYMAKIIDQLKRSHKRVPVIIFTKGGGNWLEAMADSGADCLGLDWSIDMGKAKQRVGHKVVLQGNLDPLVLCGTDQNIRSEVQRIKAPFQNTGGHIFNLGHGITPQIHPDKLTVMLDEVVRD